MTNGEMLQTIWLTLWSSALAVLLIFPATVCLAWLMARKQWPGKTLVDTLVSLPLVLPPVATGLVLLKMLGRRGPLGGWLYHNWGFEIAFTSKAVVIALGIMSFPLLVRSLRTAFEEVPVRLEGIARTLGHGPAYVFFTVSLPLAKRGIIAGIALAFARAMGEFGATIMVAGMIAGETNTLSLSIYQLVQTGHDQDAIKLLAVSVMIAFMALAISNKLSNRKARP